MTKCPIMAVAIDIMKIWVGATKCQIVVAIETMLVWVGEIRKPAMLVGVLMLTPLPPPKRMTILVSIRMVENQPALQDGKATTTLKIKDFSNIAKMTILA